MIFADSSMDVCVPTDAVYNFTYNTFLGYTGSTTFSTTGHPAGSNVVFSPASATADGTPVTMTVTSITGAAVGVSNITVIGTGTPATVTFDSQVVLNVYDGSVTVPNLTTPVDSAVGIAFPYTLTWVDDSNAASYDVDVATDAAFTNIVDTGSVVTNQYNPTGLAPTTQYYWRVRAVNTCTTTAYSTEWNFTTEDCTLCPSVANTDYATSTTRVVFNTIDNASGKPSGYSDYTAISTDVLINNSYDLTINVNTDGNYTTKTIVWIDWNQNCVFDVPSEEYDLGDAVNVTDGATDLSALSITVPAGALMGNTTMRVTTKFKADGLQTSCENDADAEVEDYTINVMAPLPDADADGIPDVNDNCVNIANPGQEDWNSDGEGDVCDDSDGDGIFDDVDNCVSIANAGQEDADGNGQGDVCQDTDNDGVFDTVDNCINTANPGQEDWDSDGEGDVCDDSDADGIFDDVDNCVSIANAGQED